jgi:preprotein translocase subunit SecA
MVAMMTSLIGRVFGSYNDRMLRRYQPKIAAINSLGEHYRGLSDEALSACTDGFRKRLDGGESVDGLLIEAYAALREASERTLKMRHFDSQLMGGIALHEGNIAEMATGEGKTLVATLALYLNGLSGQGAHLVTVNNYLAERDAKWMGPLYEFMRMRVGVVTSAQAHEGRQAAYMADITYGTNNEFGFDYLRDNMALSQDERIQRPLHFAIVDEVDSILIDEARTPLIISGAAEDISALYREINKMIPHLSRCQDESTDGHYSIDEKQRYAELTEHGHAFVEEWLTRHKLLDADGSLYEARNLSLLNHVHAALRAHALYQPNVHYVTRDKEVLLIDEHTGRTMPGRRLSEGLHQALEARENLPIQSENQTLASITFQNYFRLYGKLSGMTGTALTEAAEFQQIYGLKVVVIPTNKHVQREDLNDVIYLSQKEKLSALVDQIKECVEEGAPVLVGTISIDSSEELSRGLAKAGLKHEVLNAKQHEREAQIIANAGKPGAVTIATNMAGRGTDIVLGGQLAPDAEDAERTAWEKRHHTVVEAGGLHVLGTERHESRRIDNQLRGRSGRQGDPGLSRFFLSMDDNLMRIFMPPRIKNMMKNLGLRPGDAIEHKMVSNAIERAQRRVEVQNFQARKQLLEYDDIINVQRKTIYAHRLELIGNDNMIEDMRGMRLEVMEGTLDRYVPPGSLPDQWDLESLRRIFARDFALEFKVERWQTSEHAPEVVEIREHVLQLAEDAQIRLEEALGEELSRIARYTLLQILDILWRRHLSNIDQLRHGIHFRAYAQRNPKEEYKREAFYLFQEMLNTVKHDFVSAMAHIDPERTAMLERTRAETKALESAQAAQQGPAQGSKPPKASEHQKQAVLQGRAKKKMGRNEPCFCGSGKKYKHCHGG